MSVMMVKRNKERQQNTNDYQNFAKNEYQDAQTDVVKETLQNQQEETKTQPNTDIVQDISVKELEHIKTTYAIDKNIQNEIEFDLQQQPSAQIEKEIKSQKTISLEEGFTQLMISAACGDITNIQQLMANEAGKQTNNGVTALMCASCTNQAEIARILVSEEGKKQTVDGVTALMIGIAQGHLQVVENIMRQEYGILDHNNRNCIMVAAMSGQYQCLSKLINYLPKYQKRQKSKGKQCDVDFGARDITGRTALRYAFDCLENAYDIESEQQRMQHLKKGLQCVNILLQYEKDSMNEDNVTTLMLAAKYGGTQFFEQLKHQCGEKDKNGFSAIHYATQYNQKAFLELLIPEEIQQQDITGMTSLMLAIKYDLEEIATMLEPQELELRDFNGDTVLHYAALYNRHSFIKRYSEKFLCSVNNEGETALMKACKAGSMDAITLLIQEVEIQDNHGRTALMHAAMGGQIELVDILLEAQGMQVDKRGYTAACHACREDHPLVALKLLFEEQIQQDVHPIFVAIQFDAFNTIKAIADVARMGKTILLPDQKFTFQEQQMCLKELKAVTHNFCGYPNGLDPLGLACYLQKDGATFVLSFVGFAYNVLDASQTESNQDYTNTHVDGSLTTYDLCNTKGQSRALSQQSKKGLGCGRKIRLNGYRLKNGGVQSIQQREPGTSQTEPDDNNSINENKSSLKDSQIASNSKQKGSHKNDINDGWSSLQASLKSSNGIRPSVGPSGVTPLMLLAFQDCQISDVTIELLCKAYSCLQLIQPFGGFIQGATALMIACSMNVDNIKLIEALVPYERDCIDSEGRSALDYAKIGGRSEEIFQLLS